MTKNKRLPGPVARANDLKRREDAMAGFLGHLALATIHLDTVRRHAESLAQRDELDDPLDRDSFNNAEVSLPDDLMRLNLAVERMNADLGGWIGAG